MTEHQHPRMKEDAEAERLHAAPKKISDDIFRARKEVEEHDANMGDRNVRRDTAKDIRWMRWGVVILAAIVPPFFLFRLYGKLDKVIELVKTAIMQQNEWAVDALMTPMTVLIFGTFSSFIIIYSFLLVGLFRSVSQSSSEKKSESDILSAIRSILAAVAKKLGSGDS